jgi:hypothetical protein
MQGLYIGENPTGQSLKICVLAECGGTCLWRIGVRGPGQVRVRPYLENKRKSKKDRRSGLSGQAPA